MPTISFLEKDGSRRPLMIERDLIVLPGTHFLTDAQWETTQKAFGASGYIARGELYDEEHPPVREKRVAANATKPVPKKIDEDDTSPSVAEITEFCKMISAMKVEDAEQHIVGLEAIHKPALVALIAKDNREAIRQIAKERLAFLDG